jgi:hypothetical protein
MTIESTLLLITMKTPSYILLKNIISSTILASTIFSSYTTSAAPTICQFQGISGPIAYPNKIICSDLKTGNGVSALIDHSTQLDFLRSFVVPSTNDANSAGIKIHKSDQIVFSGPVQINNISDAKNNLIPSLSISSSNGSFNDSLNISNILNALKL